MSPGSWRQEGMQPEPSSPPALPALRVSAWRDRRDDMLGTDVINLLAHFAIRRQCACSVAQSKRWKEQQGLESLFSQ